MSSFFERYRRAMRANWRIEVPAEAGNAVLLEYMPKTSLVGAAAVGLVVACGPEVGVAARVIAVLAGVGELPDLRYSVAAACSAYAALPDGVRTPIDEAAFFTALLYGPTTPVALMMAMARMGVRLQASKAAQISRGAVRYRRKLLAEA